MKTIWTEKNDLMAAAASAMHSVEVVLDIGCGINPQSFIRPQVHICCDPYQEYVTHLQQKVDTLEKRDRNYMVLNMGWDDAVRFFPEKSVDTVFLVDIIEHLEKEEGCRLLSATENIARRQVVIFTPLGFMPQYHEDGKDAWGLNGADWQEHKSGWLPEDFDDSWKIFATREYHTADNLSRPLENPYGAFWAIKTHAGVERQAWSEQETLLKNFADRLKQKDAVLLRREEEINSLILARVERKIRHSIKSLFHKKSS